MRWTLNSCCHSTNLGAKAARYCVTSSGTKSYKRK